MQLTDQQQAIVNHFEGPALVFAVAGSGKTTCMVHRIRKLIKERRIPPRQILATSFNNSTVRDVQFQLERLQVSADVRCQTLHGLGYRIIRSAVRRGILGKEWLHSRDPEGMHTRLVNRTIVQLATEQGVDSKDLTLDREDLKNRISIWKGDLVYPEGNRRELPEAALELTSEAVHENELYPRAYAVYEKIRRENKLLTFDDMLQTGWELLVSHPEILAAVQAAYRMVMVDEFQDVNLAQYQMLDLITRTHRNYMAIGDDDQCIYEWRGASPDYILKFREVYGGEVYTISDNFRSRAQQIVPANRIIGRNEVRYPKQLSLTRGFDGRTMLQKESSHSAVARRIAGEVKALLDHDAENAGRLAILIRLYSQTAFLETAFIEARIPYRVEGNQPFYRRSELVTLFQYLSFAAMEKDIRKSGFPPEEEAGKKYLMMFENIINRPRRYISREFTEQIVRHARRQRVSALDVLFGEKAQLKGGSRKKLENFVSLIDRLIPRLDKPAYKTLSWLTDETGYRDYLLEMSGIYEVGVTRIQTVDAIIEFSRTRGRCPEFLEYIRDISLHPVENPAYPQPVQMMTIYKAKGLEWDTVFIPGCNEGLFPCLSESDGPEREPVQNVEAERRLFYVAVTRARKTLKLFYSASAPLSPFLAETAAENLLAEIGRVARLLQSDGRKLKEKAFVQFCRDIHDFHLERYLLKWAGLPAALKPALKAGVERLAPKMAAAEAEYRRYREKLAAYRAELKAAEEARDNRRQSIRAADIFVRKFKSSVQPLRSGQILRFKPYSDGGVMAMTAQGIIGVVELERMPGIGEDSVVWESCEAVVEELRSGGENIRAAFQQVTFPRPEEDAAPGGMHRPQKPAPPKNPLSGEAFRNGFEVLKKLLEAEG